MGSIPRDNFNRASSLTKKPTKSRSRRLRRAQRRINNTNNINTSGSGDGGSSCISKCSLSDKLEALRSLIPIARDGGDRADRLFEETADYILKLRSQVFVLQRLVELYGSSNNNSGSTGKGGDGDENISNNGIVICDANL